MVLWLFSGGLGAVAWAEEGGASLPGIPCEEDSECGEEGFCVDGMCAWDDSAWESWEECADDTDCAEGEVCYYWSCADAGAFCESDADCDAFSSCVDETSMSGEVVVDAATSEGDDGSASDDPESDSSDEPSDAEPDTEEDPPPGADLGYCEIDPEKIPADPACGTLCETLIQCVNFDAIGDAADDGDGSGEEDGSTDEPIPDDDDGKADGPDDGPEGESEVAQCSLICSLSVALDVATQETTDLQACVAESTCDEMQTTCEPSLLAWMQVIQENLEIYGDVGSGSSELSTDDTAGGGDGERAAPGPAPSPEAEEDSLDESGGESDQDADDGCTGAPMSSALFALFCMGAVTLRRRRTLID